MRSVRRELLVSSVLSVLLLAVVGVGVLAVAVVVAVVVVAAVGVVVVVVACCACSSCRSCCSCRRCFCCVCCSCFRRYDWCTCHSCCRHCCCSCSYCSSCCSSRGAPAAVLGLSMRFGSGPLSILGLSGKNARLARKTKIANLRPEAPYVPESDAPRAATLRPDLMSVDLSRCRLLGRRGANLLPGGLPYLYSLRLLLL